MLKWKDIIIDEIFQYSHNYWILLGDCENLHNWWYWEASILLLFNLLENTIKSNTNWFDKTFSNNIKILKHNKIITDIEYNFLDNKTNSIRIIRNIISNANLWWIWLLVNQNNKDIFYPFTESKTFLLLYNQISYLLFNLIYKIIFNDKNILDNYITQLAIRIKYIDYKEKSTLNWLPEDYLDITWLSEVDKIRLIDNSPDVNVLSYILWHILNDKKNNKN